ncbi:MAG: energy-coupling factor transporter ATPase [Christensenellales bacterium]|jgi:energy-coupling factor transport system ATP-binding protein
MPIVIENLSHVYMQGTQNEEVALKDITLTIEDGEYLGVIGHTGSGKTTLIQHINGLLKPTSGRILVYGTDLGAKKVDLRAIRRQVGIVFQYPEYQLFEDTVEKDIAFGPKQLGIEPERIPQLVAEAMETVELEDGLRSKSPLELSGGQKRRVALAGVIAMSPKTLILDEPMAGLDPQGRKSILRLSDKLHAQGKTIVMVSHSMDALSGRADRIAVMKEGRLHRVGSMCEIFADVHYLREMGLKAPSSVLLCDALNRRGVAIPPCYTMEEAADWLAKQVKPC